MSESVESLRKEVITAAADQAREQAREETGMGAIVKKLEAREEANVRKLDEPTLEQKTLNALEWAANGYNKDIITQAMFLNFVTEFLADYKAKRSKKAR